YDIKVDIGKKNVYNEQKKGFLNSLKDLNDGEMIAVRIYYVKEETDNKNDDKKKKRTNEYDTSVNRYSDLYNAIYRMCCIDLIDDFTQDYSCNCFRIIVKKKNLGSYYNGLKRFLLRYSSMDRVEEEIEKASKYSSG